MTCPECKIAMTWCGWGWQCPKCGHKIESHIDMVDGMWYNRGVGVATHYLQITVRDYKSKTDFDGCGLFRYEGARQSPNSLTVEGSRP